MLATVYHLDSKLKEMNNNVNIPFTGLLLNKIVHLCKPGCVGMKLSSYNSCLSVSSVVFFLKLIGICLLLTTACAFIAPAPANDAST